jgi:hypothetical protein
MQTRTIIDKIEIEPQTDNIRAEMRQVIDDDGVTSSRSIGRTTCQFLERGGCEFRKSTTFRTFRV